MLVEYTNIDSLQFQMFEISHQLQNVYPLLITDSARKHFLETHQAIEQFTTVLINPNDYRNHSTEVLLPPLAAGHYLVLAKVLNKTDEETFAYATIQVSNLALINTDLKQAKRFQLMDRINGEPLESATIQLWENDDKKAFETLTTDSKGFAYFNYPKKYLSNV